MAEVLGSFKARCGEKQNMRILIATDGMPHSDMAVKFAARLGMMTGGEITIIYVLGRRGRTSRADAVLDKAVALIDPEWTIEVHKQKSRGNPAKEIIRAVIQGSYDLVVLGWRPSHSHLRLSSPTVYQVIAKAPCPVVIAKSNGSQIKRILVCDSGAVTPPLLDRFTERLSSLIIDGPKVAVLHVMSQMSAGPESVDWHLNASAEDLINAHTPEGEILEHDIEELEEISVHPRPIIRHGLVVEEIVEEARKGGYDLVVIGAHHHNGTIDLLLDDLAEQIIQHIDRSILVVK